MAEYFANGSLHYQDGEWRDDNGDVVEIERVRHGEWILHMDGSGTCKRCGVTQKLVWDLDNWQNYCGHCGAKMDGVKNLIKRKDISRCRKCVYEMTCFKDRDFEGTCPSYKRDAPDGGYYG